MRVVAEGLLFPEGPVALDDGTLFVTEVAGGRVTRITPDGKASVFCETGGGPNGMAIGPDGHLYVCNNGGLRTRQEGGQLRVLHGLPDDYRGGSIQRIDFATGSVETLFTHCGDVQLRGPNDIVFDRTGGYYFTDFGKHGGRVRDVGSVFYVKAGGEEIVEVIHPIANPNGIGLSPDEKTLFVAETETSRLWSYRVLAPGELEILPIPSPNGGRLVHGLGGYQRFDSLALQANGHICQATLITGHVHVFSPDGELVRSVECPDKNTTNICFGGPDMKKAYITQSWTGKLIEMDWDEPGLRLNFQI